jgi:hypothetical protein
MQVKGTQVTGSDNPVAIAIGIRTVNGTLADKPEARFAHYKGSFGYGTRGIAASICRASLFLAAGDDHREEFHVLHFCGAVDRRLGPHGTQLRERGGPEDDVVNEKAIGSAETAGIRCNAPRMNSRCID